MLENNIAYVKIPFLAPGKAQEAQQAARWLLKKGATNVILDLRYTAGGEDKEALEVANLFIESGTIWLILAGPETTQEKLSMPIRNRR